MHIQTFRCCSDNKGIFSRRSICVNEGAAFNFVVVANHPEFVLAIYIFTRQRGAGVEINGGTEFPKENFLHVKFWIPVTASAALAYSAIPAGITRGFPDKTASWQLGNTLRG